MSKKNKTTTVETRYNLALQLRKVRIENEMTLEEVAEKSKLPIVKLQNLEMGNFKDLSDVTYLTRFYGKKLMISLV